MNSSNNIIQEKPPQTPLKKKAFINKKGINKYVPITAWLPAYKRRFLVPDLIAAITLTFVSVPQAIAFAQMAGVPPVVGFYTLPLSLLAYAIFGSSRHIMAGPTSTGAVLSFALVSTIVAGDPGKFLALTTALAIISGIIFLFFGIAKLGFIANFISKPVITGFIFGIVLVMIIGQIPKLFGITGIEGNFFIVGVHIINNLNSINWWTFTVGTTSLLILFLLEKFVSRIPAAIIVLVYGILLVTFFGLENRGVAIIGDLPSGLPKFGIPDVTIAEIIYLIPGAIGIVLVGFAGSLGAARSFASKHDYEIDPNQELIAYGVANIGSGFSSGFTVDGSLSRSATSEKAGAKTQMTAIISIGLTLIIALWFTPFFKNLPQSTLAAIIIHAIWRMMRIKEMKRIFSIRKIDFLLAALALIAVLIFDILNGLIIATFASLLAITIKASLPYLAILGIEPNNEIYSDIERHPNNIQTEGLLILRPDAQIFFANIGRIKDEIISRVKSSPKQISAVILSLESTVELDTDSIDALFEIQNQLNKLGIKLMLTRVRSNVRDTLVLSKFAEEIGQNNIFKTVNEAVAEYKKKYSTS